MTNQEKIAKIQQALRLELKDQNLSNEKIGLT